MQQKVLSSLNSLQGLDNQKRKEAENYIIQESITNFANLISILLDILTLSTLGSMGNTMTAGLVLKTLFAWESQEKMQEVNLKWMALKPADRDLLKSKLIASLATCSGSVGEILGQCLGAVARIEVVNKRWPTVFSDLSEIAGAASSDVTRINVMETMGILCMDTTGMDDTIIMHSSGHILTVLINGGRSDNVSTQKSAFKNLDRCLEFISHNIAIESECMVVMETLFNACASSSDEIACLAMRCYTGTLYMYYESVVKYVGLAFGNIAMNYMYSESDTKILSAMEMWGAVAEHEIETGKSEIISKVFSTLVGQCIILARNLELEQTDEWLPHKAASSLLSLVSQCVPDKISQDIVNRLSSTPVNLITAVENFINSQDVVRFEAGMIVLGSILNEDTANALSKLIQRIVPVIYKASTHGNPVVEDSKMWLFEKLFKYSYVSVEQCHLEDDIIREIMKLITKKNGETSVTAAWTLMGIASAVRQQSMYDAARQDHAIFTNFTMILESLVGTFYNLPNEEYTLRVALSSAIGEIIKAAIPTYYSHVLGYLSEFISRTTNELMMPDVNEEAISCYMNMIQACISTCSSDQISHASRSIVSVCTYIIDRSKLISLYTEAYLTLDLLAERISIDFANYTEELYGLIVRDLNSFCSEDAKEEGTSIFATSLIMFIGSMASAVQLGFSSQVNQIVPLLIRAVGSPYLPREAKATAISTFADISLAIGKIFDKYLGDMIDIAASVIKLKDDGSDSGFILSLRESLLVLFSCIVQASNGKSEQVVGHVEVMLEIIKIIVIETNDSACVIKSLYLISDLWVLYGTGEFPPLITALESPWVFEFITAKTRSDVREVRDAATATRLQISYINNE
ncbi:importin subunit beta-1 [Nematocida minor]|uniref:importin subunit beta-1 n=1 Tax=Nematocida minor TaxID=1912983 RepID=UPI0022203D6E|nr:importin subunit beta-1 [Nematocida minor]KAI5191600.1 importin subunit beta-1 [Nematocida minor]